MVIMTPLPGRRYRVYTRTSSPETDFIAAAAAVIAIYEPGATLEDIENPGRFTCHAKVADFYREGRVLLTGDAAHVCSPDQGHGMNCGIQDAANLAWKLAVVCDGAAPAYLLYSYGAERRPVAIKIAESGEAMEAMGRFDGAEARVRRDRELQTAFANPDTVLSEAVAEAELNIAYRSSPIVAGESDGSLGPGDRLPDLGPIQLPGVDARRLHELTRRPGHTLLALARGDGGGGLLALLGEVAAATALPGGAREGANARLDVVAGHQLGGRGQPVAAEPDADPWIGLEVANPAGVAAVLCDQPQRVAVARAHDRRVAYRARAPADGLDQRHPRRGDAELEHPADHRIERVTPEEDLEPPLDRSVRRRAHRAAFLRLHGKVSAC